jgi:thiol-disulfide isomerase/thioredoxin/DNA-binding beta-propeller fold protein YncE
MTSDDRLAPARAKARELIEQNARLGIRAPEFGADKTWLNVARPLSWKESLSGKLVLLDFWTYCCINCMHVARELEVLERKYASAPLVVVGVHSAKFANESDAAHVRTAVLREHIEHPVVVDRDFDLWTRFAIRAWPTLVLVSPDGRLIGQVSGEGQGAVLDVFIEQALAVYGERRAFDARALPLRRERDAELARELRFPGKVAADGASRRLYIADSGHDRIVVTDFDGRFVASYGDGEPGLVDGDARTARFCGPQGLALHRGELIVADTLNHALRSIDLSSGEVTTIAGTGKQGYERGSGVVAARSAALNSPWDVCVAGHELVVAMAGAHQIWSLDPLSQTIRALAGDGHEARRDGPFVNANFAQPSGVVAMRERVYAVDSESSSVRVLDLGEREVTTLAGGDDDPRDLFHFGDEDGAGLGRRFQHPLGICADAGETAELAMLYVADSYNHKLKLVDPHTGAVATYAGTGQAGFADGLCERAQFDEPGGLCIASGADGAVKLFVADTNNHAIRAVDLETHEVTTLALSGVPIPPRMLSASTSAAVAGSALPRLATTVVHAPVRVKLSSGEAEIELRLALGAGEKRAENAPSQYRVLHEDGLVAARSVGARIDSDVVKIPLGVAGPGRVRVQALYYVCDEKSGACGLRSAEWTVEVQEHARGGRRVVLDAAAPSA